MKNNWALLIVIFVGLWDIYLAFHLGKRANGSKKGLTFWIFLLFGMFLVIGGVIFLALTL